MAFSVVDFDDRHLPGAGQPSSPGTSATESEAFALMRMALVSPQHAKERFPDFRLTRLVTARLDMDDTDAVVFANIIDRELLDPFRTIQRPFDYHLRNIIRNYRLGALFSDDGPGLHHHAVRPTGYDFDRGEVVAAGMEQWRADYRAMNTERQMLAASILWLYRAGPDNRWLRRVPCTWHAVDAIAHLRRAGALGNWGGLITLYPGW